MLLEYINSRKLEDGTLCIIQDKVLRAEAKDEILDPNGVLRIKGQIYVPRVGDLTRLILKEAQNSRYSIHPSVAKIYHGIK